MTAIEPLLERISAGERSPLYLVAGDLVLAEPAAVRLAAALAGGAVPQVRRRPTDLGPLVADLRTFSLFGGAKVLVAVDSAILADRRAAAALVAEALEATPPRSATLSDGERAGASRLLQALHLFAIDPAVGAPEEVIAGLPDWALAGASGGRLGKQQAATRREALAALLSAARTEGLRGGAEEGIAALGDVLRRGLPPGHALILVERSIAADHPLVVQLKERGAVAAAGQVLAERRGGWSGAEALAGQLAGEVGVEMRGDAVAELARRTLRQQDARGGSASGGASGDSTARFAAEYRKLAELSGGRPIDRRLVESAVEDRGEEDVWQLLDALGEGRTGEAMSRLDRLLAAADDAAGARLAFFGLLASFCRHVVAVGGLVERLGLPRGERSYPRFRDRLAPALAAPLPEGDSPVAGLHAFRLHRAYLAASRLSAPALARLPWRLLETELALKGESAEPGAALAAFLAELAPPASRPAERHRSGA